MRLLDSCAAGMVGAEFVVVIVRGLDSVIKL